MQGTGRRERWEGYSNPFRHGPQSFAGQPCDRSVSVHLVEKKNCPLINFARELFPPPILLSHTCFALYDLSTKLPLPLAVCLLTKSHNRIGQKSPQMPGLHQGINPLPCGICFRPTIPRQVLSWTQASFLLHYFISWMFSFHKPEHLGLRDTHGCLNLKGFRKQRTNKWSLTFWFSDALNVFILKLAIFIFFLMMN